MNTNRRLKGLFHTRPTSLSMKMEPHLTNNFNINFRPWWTCTPWSPGMQGTSPRIDWGPCWRPWHRSRGGRGQLWRNTLWRCTSAGNFPGHPNQPENNMNSWKKFFGEITTWIEIFISCCYMDWNLHFTLLHGLKSSFHVVTWIEPDVLNHRYCYYLKRNYFVHYYRASYYKLFLH